MESLPSLVILHGSRGTHQELLPLAQALTQVSVPRVPNLLGHGGREIPDRFTIRDMAFDILRQMDYHSIETTYLFGYSFGGYIALYLARHVPERILGVCTLATKFVFDEHTVKLFTHLSSVERIKNMEQELMDQLHPGQDWTRMVQGLTNLYQELGRTPQLTESDLRSITIPALIISAHEDQLVPWAESLRLASLIPKSQGFTFAGKAHPFNIMPVPFLASIISKWLESAS
jgi:pimeloyl-ACP methyl ester carboxylesterase